MRIIAVILVLASLGACTTILPPQPLRMESLGDRPIYLSTDYVIAFYGEHQATETSFLLADVTTAQLLSGEISRGQIVHVNLLWLPEAGSTPMDASATNASVRYVVVADGEVGVYGGTGFALPMGDTGEPELSVLFKDASLTLLDSTDGFVDLLSPARLTGTFTAKLNPSRTRQLRFALSQFVTNALGHSRLVDATEPSRSSSSLLSSSWSASSSWWSSQPLAWASTPPDP